MLRKIFVLKNKNICLESGMLTD